jgi:hypothetical protein
VAERADEMRRHGVDADDEIGRRQGGGECIER